MANENITKQQLHYLMQRYTSVKFIDIDNNNATLTVSSDTANFKKPIFAVNSDCNKVSAKLLLAMQYQAAATPSYPDVPFTRIVVEGNLDLVQNTMKQYKKLIGDDPYNPKQPFTKPIMLMEGSNIPEYQLSDEDITI